MYSFHFYHRKYINTMNFKINERDNFFNCLSFFFPTFVLNSKYKAKLKFNQNMKNLAIILFSVFHFFQLNAQCEEGESQIVIEILTDNYSQETSYTLTGADGTVYLVRDNFPEDATLYSDTVCVENNQCLTFKIYDSVGDGICCGFGIGGYALSVDGDTIATGGDYDREATELINCPPGTVCNTPFETSTGDFVTEGGNTWYTFTPTEVGMYLLGTCLPDNSCNTALWIYDDCSNIVDNTVQGTFIFNDDNDNCGELAELSVALDTTTTYFIRVGSVTNDCADTNIHWTLQYLGPVVGCIDPNSCNYNPLATEDDGSCIYPGDPDCPEGPDLIVREDVFANSMYISYLNNADDCLREEGCLAGYGTRELLRFDTRIDNIGTIDYHIGQSPNSPDDANDQWEFDACHSHWHYEGYAEYRVYDDNGLFLPLGFKNGFCVLDLVCDAGTAQFSCGVQGISSGCGDIYGAGLSCQWFDITELPAGQYTFVIVVNWDRSPDARGFQETTYENNWAQVCLDIVRDPITNQASFTIIEECVDLTDCEGVTFGDAQLDCAGDCNGARIEADINIDGIRNNEDITFYIQESLADTMAAASCFDLNTDDDISVIDLQLLLYCTLHEDQGQQPEHNHLPCQFPYAVENINQLVTLGVGDYDVTEKWFNVGILNPQNAVAAFEFEISGATIASVESLVPDYEVSLHHDATEILGFSYQEDVLVKHSEYLPLLRVHVEEWTDVEVCIANITAIVNDKLEETLTAAWNCAAIPLSKVTTPIINELKVTVSPNPTQSLATLTFDNPARRAYEVEVLNAQGQVVWQRSDFRDHQVTFQVRDYPAGIYFYRIVGGGKMGLGKFVVE